MKNWNLGAVGLLLVTACGGEPNAQNDAADAAAIDADGSKLGTVVVAETCSGEATLDLRARDLMTSEVVTCSLEATIEQLMAEMTERRFRHVPVTEDGVLVGIVSIGDVVNARVRNLEIETEQLTNYISGR